MVDTFWVGIQRIHLAAFAEKIDEVAAVAAASIEYAHARSDVAAQDLVEDVDVDQAELVLEG